MISLNLKDICQYNYIPVPARKTAKHAVSCGANKKGEESDGPSKGTVFYDPGRFAEI
jgi:hypothetical protein